MENYKAITTKGSMVEIDPIDVEFVVKSPLGFKRVFYKTGGFLTVKEITYLGKPLDGISPEDLEKVKPELPQKKKRFVKFGNWYYNIDKILSLSIQSPHVYFLMEGDTEPKSETPSEIELEELKKLL